MLIKLDRTDPRCPDSPSKHTGEYRSPRTIGCHPSLSCLGRRSREFPSLGIPGATSLRVLSALIACRTDGPATLRQETSDICQRLAMPSPGRAGATPPVDPQVTPVLSASATDAAEGRSSRLLDISFVTISRTGLVRPESGSFNWLCESDGACNCRIKAPKANRSCLNSARSEMAHSAGNCPGFS